MTAQAPDTFDILLWFIGFMSLVAALPTESERENMTGRQFAYAVMYRFLQNLCINVQRVNPALGASYRKDETTSKDAKGNVEHKSTETGIAVIVPKPTEQP